MKIAAYLIILLANSLLAQGSAYFPANTGNTRIRIADAAPVNGMANPSAYQISGSNITMEMWVFPIELPGINQGAILVRRPANTGFETDPYRTFDLIINNYSGQDNPRFAMELTDGTSLLANPHIFVSDTVPPAIGVWTHVAGTYDGTTAKLYINGGLVAQQTFSLSMGTGSTGLYIGGTAGTSFEGLLDEVRLWNITRTQAEIQSNMNSTLAGNEPGLAGYWKFDEAAGAAVAVDATSNHNDLSVQNGATFVSSSFGQTVHFANIIIKDIDNLDPIVGRTHTYSVKGVGTPAITSLVLAGAPDGAVFAPVTADSGYITWTPDASQVLQDGSGAWILQVGAVSSEGTIYKNFYLSPSFAHSNSNQLAYVRGRGAVGRSNSDAVNGVGGYYHNGVNGLFDGSLVVAKDLRHVSGDLFVREFFDQSVARQIASPIAEFDQTYETIFNDNLAKDDQSNANPIGITVRQRSYSKPGSSYLLYQFDIVNSSGASLDSVYVGVHTDWDVGNAGANLGGYDATRNLSYIYDQGATDPSYYGVITVSGTPSGQIVYPNGQDLTDSATYVAMQNTLGGGSVAGDQRALIAMGPYSIPVGGEIRTVFAVAGGDNLADLQLQADSALSKAPLFVDLPTAFSQLRMQDSLALVDLYNATSGPSWTNKTNWLSSSPINSWFGVRMLNGRVDSLLLFDNNLVGTIPNSIGDLSALRTLSLVENYLQGALPSTITNLTQLTHLEIFSNKGYDAGYWLSGPVPAGLWNMTQLVHLDLSPSNVVGDFSQIGNLVNLQILSLPTDSMSGSLPSTIGNLMNLRELYLNNNAKGRLSGSIPSTIGNLTNLEYLWLYGNQLTGSIPSEIGNLTNLKQLYLYNNALTGSIPSQIGNLSNLLHLNLQNNQLTGVIPSTVSGLTSIQRMLLDHNQLTGSIPNEIYSLTTLQRFNVWRNQMSGSISPLVGNLTNLQLFSLDSNNFSGTIPPEIGNLTNLNSLFLNDCQFTGSIPSEIGNCTALYRLELQQNQFTGSIPSTFSNLTSLSTFRANNNSLSGQLPYLPKVSILDVSHNLLNDSIPSAYSSSSYLQQLIANDNQLVFVPDLSSVPGLDTISIQNNRLTFESIEPNVGVADSLFSYSPQDSVGQYTSRSAVPSLPITLHAAVGGSANIYQWSKDGNDLNGETGSNLTIDSFGVSDAGSYSCRATNSIVPSLIIYTRSVGVVAATNLAMGSAYFPSQKSNARVRVADGSPNNVQANVAAFQNVGSNMTVEAWVFPMSVPGTNSHFTIVSRPTINAADPFAEYQLSLVNYQAGFGYPNFEFKVSSGAAGQIVYASSADQVQPGQWYHVAGTYDGSMARIYVNGVLKSEVSFSQAIGTAGPGFYIGGTFNGFNERFHGLISDVRLWNTARTQSQIELAMLGVVDASTPGLVGNWLLDEASGSLLAVDRTTNHNDLNVQNGAIFVSGIIPGSSVEVAPISTNFTAPDASVGNQLRIPVSKSGYPAPTLSIFSSPSGVALDVDTVVWMPSSGQTGLQTIVVRQTNSVGQGDLTYTTWVDAFAPLSVDHSNNNITLSVFNNGAVGGVEGNAGGLQVNGHRGLFEADLVIAQSDTQISGSLFSREFATGSAVTVASSEIAGFDQAYESQFNDGRADYPIGLSVRQRSHSKPSSPDQNYVIIDYEITNTSGQDLQNIYVGITADWDIGSTAQDNLGVYDAVHYLNYVYQNGQTEDPNYYGMIPILGNVSGHGFYANGTDGDEPELYQRLTTDAGGGETPVDIRAVLGNGPFSIPAGRKIHVPFALAAAGTLPELQNAADAARMKFDALNHAPQFVFNTRPDTTLMEGFSNAFIGLLTDNVHDEEGQALTITATSLEPSMTATLSNDSLFVSALTDYFGTARVVLMVSDGTLSSNDTITVTVLNVNDPPVLTTAVPDTSMPEDFGTVLVRRLVNYFTDIDGPALSYDAQALSSGVTVSHSADSVSIASTADFNGTVNIAVSATDGEYTARDTFSVTVTGINDPPVRTVAIRDTTLGQNFAKARISVLTNNFSDVDNVTLTYRDTVLGTGVTSQISNDTLYLRSVAGFTGTTNVHVYASDGQYTVADTFQVTVVDTVKPVLFYGVLASELVDKVRIVAGANEALSQLSVTVNSQSLSMTKQGDAYFNTFQLTSGPLALSVTASDLASNQSTASKSYTVSLLSKPSPVGRYTLAAKAVAGFSIASTTPVEYEGTMTNLSDGLELLSTAGPEELTLSCRYEDRLEGLQTQSKFHEGKVGFYELIGGQWTYAGGQGKNGQVTTKITGNNRVAVFYDPDHYVIPDEFALGTNYPNPFNPSTTLRFELPQDSKVTLRIYNILGQEVRTLINAQKPAGIHEVVWDGRDSRGMTVSSGVYLYRIEAGKFSKTRKMMFLK